MFGLTSKLGVLTFLAIFFGILAFMVIAGGKLEKKDQEEKLKKKDGKE